MEILKQGNPQDITYLHKCETCGCVMLFKESEKQKDNKGTFVTCPTCGERVDVNGAMKVGQNYNHCYWCLHSKSHGWDGMECTKGKHQECMSNNWKHFESK